MRNEYSVIIRIQEEDVFYQAVDAPDAKSALEKAVKEFNEKTGKWTYLISSYSADSMSKARKDLVKAKEEPKKDEAKKADDKKADAKDKAKGK